MIWNRQSVTVSGAFALYYAIIQFLLNRRGWALILSSGLGLAFVVCTVILVIKYRFPRGGGANR